MGGNLHAPRFPFFFSVRLISRSLSLKIATNKIIIYSHVGVNVVSFFILILLKVRYPLKHLYLISSSRCSEIRWSDFSAKILFMRCLSTLFQPASSQLWSNNYCFIQQKATDLHFPRRVPTLYIPNVVDDCNPLHKSVDNFRRKATKSLRIACIGRLVPFKNQISFINALLMLKKSNIDFDAHIIGSGPMASSIQSHIYSLDLESNVSMTSFPSIKKFLSTVDLVVCCSLPGEGTPNILLESAMEFIPFISTPYGDCSRLCMFDRYIIPTSSSFHIYSSIVNFLNLSPSDVHADTVSRHKFVSEEFSMNNLISHINRHLSELNIQ